MTESAGHFRCVDLTLKPGTGCSLEPLKLSNTGNFTVLMRLGNCVQFVIKSFLVHEIRVSSRFHHFSVLENHDAVGVLDCGEAVSDDDARPALLSSFQSFLYDLEKQGNNDCDTWFGISTRLPIETY